MAGAFDSADSHAGREIGPYVLETRLGAGGMGVVFRAYDRRLNRHVAIKLLAPHLTADAEARRRFQDEILVAAGVEHPNVVPVYDGGIDDSNNFFIVMRLIDGPDLEALLNDGPLPQERALRLFHQVADAIQRIHNMGLVHRDIKPHNILLWNEGASNEQALVTDFGIAKNLDSKTLRTMGIPGTPDYVAPEIAQWQPATPESDQYSLACVLFKMLSGESPYLGHEVPLAHIEEPVPDMQQRLPGVSRTIQAALARALAKDPPERFPSVDAFADALETTEPDGGSHVRALSLHAELAEVLALRPTEWLLPTDLASRVNERRRASGADPVTSVQVEARVRAFPQLFRRRGDLVQLRHPGGATTG